MEEYPVKKSFNSLARPGPRAGFFKSELVRSKVFFLMVNIFALLPFSSFRTLDTCLLGFEIIRHRFRTVQLILCNTGNTGNTDHSRTCAACPACPHNAHAAASPRTAMAHTAHRRAGRRQARQAAAQVARLHPAHSLASSGPMCLPGDDSCEHLTSFDTWRKKERKDIYPVKL